MPDLKKLYSETAGKGLVWITIDSDDEPAEVTAFLSRERIPWPNYHDDDGSWGRVFERQGIPLGVLIDANGNVAFYKAGYEISDLRAALVKLSSEFSSRANPNLK